MPNQTWRRVSSVLLLLLSLAGVSAPPTDAAPRFIARTSAQNLVTDGRFAAWWDAGRLRAIDLWAGEPFTVAREPEAVPMSLDRGVLVWLTNPEPTTDRKTIRARDLTTGVETLGAEGGFELGRPHLDYPWVVWQCEPQAGTATAVDIVARSLTSPGPPVRLTSRPYSYAYPEINDLAVGAGWVAWIQEPKNGLWSVWLVPLTGASAAPILAAQVPFVPSRGGGRIVPPPPVPKLFIGGDHLAVSSLTESSWQVITLSTGDHWVIPADALGTISDLRGRYAVSQRDFGIGTGLRVYDMLTHAVLDFLPPKDVRSGQYQIRVSNDVIFFWLLDNNHLYVLPVSDLFPTQRRVPPELDPNLAYFPETGHTLAGGFKDFWERSGGLAVFGYPLTEEFSRNDLAAGRLVTAQIIERQRFERHSELADTPYEVSLGQLGREDAARRADLRGLWAFNPVAAEAEQPAGCRYLAESQHRLCGEFRPYWEGHGLDFGDEGVSFREALALFGYPISEEFVDPATELITQYFERAVFEYHPDLPVGRRVLLRRLGAEDLARAGW